MSRRFVISVLAFSLALLFQAGPRVSAQSGGAVVISQVYGGGGNSGGIYRNDFIELFNRSAASVNVTGWTVQYASAAGTTWQFTPLIGTIPPGGYYLVQEAVGAGSQPLLPTPDATGSIAMSATAGKVALVAGAVALTGTCPAGVVDFLGYGPTANCSETTPAPVLANPTAALRLANGCTDTNANNNDFTTGTPAPRNSASPAAPCGGGGTNPGFSSVTASPSPVQQGQTLTVFAAVVPGSGPVSTGLVVTGDFSQVGGGAAQPLSDNGVAPDIAVGDGVYTTSVAVPALNPLGARTITLAVTDAQSRSGSGSFSVTVTTPPVILLPHEIQGSGDQSPLPIGTAVTVRGVVTARKSNGFFIQTLASQVDADLMTSEGLLIFTGSTLPPAAAVGRLVEVSGAVDEFGDPGVTVTEVKGNPTITVTDLGDAAVPDAYTLDLTFPSPSGARNQLERLEGMRVSVASVTATAGTDGQVSEANATSSSFGEVDVVVTGHPRPFREPGLEPGTPALTCAIGPCDLPLWDGNPELFRIDTNGIAGTATRNVSSGAVFTNVVGPLDHAFGNYVVLAETQLEPVAGLTFVAAPPATSTQFTVASFNMERFYDTVNDPGVSDVALTLDAYNLRLTKASLAIRNALNLPDIIGVQEVEKLDVLSAIATRVNADAGPADPQYVAYLEEGLDVGGIDVGFLVKTAGGRVTVQSVEQVGFDATFVDPSDLSIDVLNDRPPLVLRATVQGPATSLPQEVTVIVNHLRSLNGVDEESATGVRVRAKRQAQAEFLANLIDGLQDSEAVISVGDYNAFSFNDGLGDSMGTIRGEPAPPDQVVTAASDLIEPNLVDVAQFIPAEEQYSYVFEGSAQTLDHVLVTQGLASQFVDLVHPRINADAAAILRGDPTTPQRLSDHDPAVAYFTFPPDVDAPVFSFAPTDQSAEATGPDGAAVTYEAPSATDNLDPAVTVMCTPASGTRFGLGSTGVTCSVSDVAGNIASVSFSVTVVDTTAPALTVPSDISDEASSPAGQRVTFTASATDLVTISPTIACTPVSGSTFPLGVNSVTCSATDLAGNSTSASFTVTITPPVAGRMHGAGGIGSAGDRVWFALDVRESVSYVDRGWLIVKMADRPGRPDHYFAANVTDVRFSNQPGYDPGRPSGGGIDTVSFTGVGFWNGQGGHTYAVVASDRGEPGGGHDTFEVVIRNAAGAVVAAASGTLRNGNLQSLR